MKFQKGDRVVADIYGTWIGATVEAYDEDGSDYVYCIWDYDGKSAGVNESELILEDVFNSPLYKAMK